MDTQTNKRRSLLQILALVILAAFVVILLKAGGAFSTSVTTLNTNIVTANEYIGSTGYIFRNETVLTAERTGPVLYLTPDDDKVATNTQLAIMYGADSEATESLQEQITDLQTRISFLESAIGEGTNLSKIGEMRATVRNLLLRTNRGLNDGNLSAVLEAQSSILASLTGYHVLTDEESHASEMLAALREQLETTMSSFSREGVGIYNATTYDPQGANPGSYATDHGYTMPESGIPEGSLSFRVGSGYFYRSSHVDGYESLFTSETLDNLTTERFRSLTSSSSVLDETGKWSDGKSVLGKMVLSPEWHLVIPLEADGVVLRNAYGDFTGWQIERDGEILSVVNEGTPLSVTFNERPDDPFRMRLDRVVVSNDDGILLICSSFDMPSEFTFTRVQTVKILMNSVTGYHVPESAIRTWNGYEGVFVLVGNRVEFRRITVLYRGDGYCIAEDRNLKKERLDRYRSAIATDVPEEEAAQILHEGDADYAEFLYLNDQILTGSTDLYPGKILK